METSGVLGNGGQQTWWFIIQLSIWLGEVLEWIRPN